MSEANLTADVYAKQPQVIRVIAKIISYVFHPLFIPTYILIWLSWHFLTEFIGITERELLLKKISVFWITAFFPAFSVFISWRLKFVDSIFLRTQKDRIVPYVITMIFYWWMWYLSRDARFIDQPVVLKFFYFGIFLTTVFGLIINNFIKISMHAIGAGSFLAFIILTCLIYHTLLGVDIMIATLLAGLICTARLLLNHHSTAEIYSGLILGIFCQLLGIWIAL